MSKGFTMKKAQAMRETGSEIGITARFADREIAHLEKIFRSAHFDDMSTGSEPYWRKRIEHLRAAPLLLPQQRARLDSLLGGLTPQPLVQAPARAYY
jgi:hypothetical protein